MRASCAVCGFYMKYDAVVQLSHIIVVRHNPHHLRAHLSGSGVDEWVVGLCSRLFPLARHALFGCYCAAMSVAVLFLDRVASNHQPH